MKSHRLEEFRSEEGWGERLHTDRTLDSVDLTSRKDTKREIAGSTA
jgi:hypothetical protein